MERFEIHTNFTGTAKQVHRFTLDDLASDPKEPLRLLRAAFQHPEELKPTVTRQELTEEAAKSFADLAIALRGRGHEPQVLPTSSTACCSACSLGTQACCPGASSSAWRALPEATPPTSARDSATCSRA